MHKNAKLTPAGRALLVKRLLAGERALAAHIPVHVGAMPLSVASCVEALEKSDPVG